MLYPCAPHAPTGGRGWYGCNRVGRWAGLVCCTPVPLFGLLAVFVPVGGVLAVGLVCCTPVPLFGRLRGVNCPVWPVGVGRWSVGRVPVPPVGGLPLTGATGLAVGLFLFSHIQFVFVGGGGTIPNVGRWPVGLFQLPVGWVGLFLFLCWPSEVGGGWLAVWRVPVPCVGQTGAGLVCCTPVPLLAVCGRVI